MRALRRILAFVLAAGPACAGAKKPQAPAPEPIAPVPQVGFEERLINLANVELEAGRWELALRRAEQALEENPNSPGAYAVIGRAHWRGGDPSRSTAAYERALEISATHFGAGIALAGNRRAAGDHVGALELLSRMADVHPEQEMIHLNKLWSYYARANAELAVKELDQIFQVLSVHDPVLPLVQAYAAFMRPLAGHGTLCKVDGGIGSTDAALDHTVGLKTGTGVLGGQSIRVAFFENLEEAVVDTAFAKQLGLKTLAEFVPIGHTQKMDIVLIPKIQFGGVALRRVPATVRDLSPYEAALGEKPGIVLGRQAMQAFGALEFDFPAGRLTLHKTAPKEAPARAIEVPLMLLDARVVNAPIVPVRIDGSDHEFWALLGGVAGSSVTASRDAYLKSGHRPAELEPPDDPQAMLKMVYVEDLTLGDAHLGGMGGLVLLANPADANIDSFLLHTGFEIGGYINTRLMASWSITYALNSGKAFIRVP